MFVVEYGRLDESGQDCHVRGRSPVFEVARSIAQRMLVGLHREHVRWIEVWDDEVEQVVWRWPGDQEGGVATS